MPSIDDYRSKFPSLRDLPDEALISRVAEVHNTSREDVMAHMGYNPSDLGRGLKESFQQLPQLAWGAAAGVGAAGEAAFGEGGLMSGLKKAGIKGYTEWSDKIESKSRESDSFNYSWDQAKEGNFGALVDWVQHGLGYVTGQGIQALATAGIGAIGGKMVLSEAAKTVAKGMVQKEAAVIAGTEAGKQLGKDELIKMATTNVASKIGQTVGLGGMAVGQEGGEIFGDLTAQADNDGRQLTGDDLAKAFGATLAAGGLEFVGDKLGLDIVMGKTGLTKMVGGAQGLKGKLARGAIAGTAAVPAEAGTEYFQTGLEEFGKGTEQNMLPFNQSAKAQEGAFDAAALGALGGGGIGMAGGLMSKARAKVEQDMAANTLATTTDVGQMVKAAETLAMAPLDEGRALDRLDQLRGEDEKAAKIFGTAPVSAQERAVNSAAMAAAVNNGQASATLTDMPQADRALVLQEQLADPATRQAIREKLGDQALDDALYYAGISDRPNGTLDAPIPEKTRERMLSLAETIVSRAVLQPINRPGMGGPDAAPGIGMNPAQQRITLDTGSTGNIRVDSAGNAAPETRADAINTAQARQRPDGMTQQVDRRPLPRDAVMVGDGTLTAPERRQRPEPAAPGPQLLLTTDGMPYGTKSAATVRAKKEGGQVVDVQGGWAVEIQGDANGLPARGTPGPADMAAGTASVGSDQPAGGRGDLVPDARPAERVDSGVGSPVRGGGPTAPVQPASGADGALSTDIPTLRKAWQDAAQAGDNERAKQISDRITALKKAAQPAPAVDASPKPVEQVDTLPKRVDEKPKSEHVAPAGTLKERVEAKKADAPAEREAFDHAGLKVYPGRVRVGDKIEDRWAVQLPENKATGKVLGDTLHATREEAMKAAEQEVLRYERDQRNRAEQDAAETARKAEEESRKEANRGKSIKERAAAVTLDRETSENGERMTRRQWVDRKVAEGLTARVTQEDKIKPLTRSQFNRASGEEQRDHERKIKEAGKKDVFWIGDYEVTKTEYDYAQESKASTPAAAQTPLALAAPVTPQDQAGTPSEGAAAPTQPAEKPSKPEAAPKAKRPPKSFRTKQMVTTTVLVEETGKFEKREIDAETAMVALDADINELEAFLKCLKG